MRLKSRSGPIRVAALGLRGLPNVIGGIETHCERLYPPLAAQAPDLDVHLITRQRYSPKGRDWFGAVRVHSLWSPASSKAETSVHTVLGILFAKLKLRSEIIHLHGIGPGFFAPLAKALGMRVVVTHHGADFERPKWHGIGRSFLQAGEAIAARSADAVVCVSEALRRDFLSRHPAAAPRTLTILHGAPTQEPPVAAEARAEILGRLGLQSKNYILAVGRLEETKRFEDLIEAHARAGPLVPPLVIVGEAIGSSEYGSALRAAAGPNVVFAGYQGGASLRVLYEDASLFVHPSAMEGFGLVVLEALTAGVPVRLSDIPPHREFALSNDAYFAVGDVRQLTNILTNKSRSSVRPAQSQIYARYDASTSVKSHALIYRSLGQRVVESSDADVSGAQAKDHAPRANPKRSVGELRQSSLHD